MEKLQIGEVIYKLRKGKGITQEQLANFIGVSAAAVSKWESGTSYPDITLLPIIANFFNVTIDKLLNFKVELSEDEIDKICDECVKEFNTGGLEVFLEKTKDYLSKYPSSYTLKYKVAFLIFGCSWKAENDEQLTSIFNYIIGLYEDVVANCNDINLVEPSLLALGTLYSENDNNDKAIEALNKIHKNECDPDTILANIYIKQNKLKEARNLLQSKLYKCIIDMALTCLSLTNAYVKGGEDFVIIEKYHNMAINCKKLASTEGEGALSLWIEYFFLAQAYMKANKRSEAINSLNAMLECLKSNSIDGLKDINNVWCFCDVDISCPKENINLYENLFKMLESENFNSIREDKEFEIIIKDLKSLEEEYNKKK